MMTPAATTPHLPPPAPTKTDRRNATTLKLLFLVGLVVVLQLPLSLINGLRQERMANREAAVAAWSAEAAPEAATAATEGYRMVERSLKHSALVIALVCTAFFLFETLAGVRLHPLHYGLVAGALVLFYLALLALGEVLAPGVAYIGAAVASSVLVVCYSAAILRTWTRAGVIAGMLAAVHSVLYIVLRMEAYALLAGTAALFAALGAVMFFTRNVDWYAEDTAPKAAR